MDYVRPFSNSSLSEKSDWNLLRENLAEIIQLITSLNTEEDIEEAIRNVFLDCTIYNQTEDG